MPEVKGKHFAYTPEGKAKAAKYAKKTGKGMPYTPFKMKGFSGFGNSPVKDRGEVVSTNSPGEGWTKTPGTNIWAPPKPKMGRMMKESKKLVRKQGLKDSVKKVLRKSTSEGATEAAQQVGEKRTIMDETKMKPPYKRPVGPRE